MTADQYLQQIKGINEMYRRGYISRQRCIELKQELSAKAKVENEKK